MTNGQRQVLDELARLIRVAKVSTVEAAELCTHAHRALTVTQEYLDTLLAAEELLRDEYLVGEQNVV